jgi:hypothetical protein
MGKRRIIIVVNVVLYILFTTSGVSSFQAKKGDYEADED